MRDKGQVFIFNDEELSLIKNTFADNEPLLYAVRKVLLQFPLTGPERGLIELSVTPEVLAVLKKRILPEISGDFPLTQLPSLLTTLSEQLKIRSVEEMEPLLAAKSLELSYLNQQFDALEHVAVNVKPKYKLADMAIIEGRTARDAFVGVTAYLFLLGYIDPMLMFIQSIAGSKTESIGKLKERLQRNSNK